jgi:hypothetical protein
MIQTLIATAIEHSVPFSCLFGTLEPGIARRRDATEWAITSMKSPWRPAGETHLILGRVVPPAPLPSYDKLEIQSAQDKGKGSFEAYQQHRLCFRVPQREPFSMDAYEQVDLGAAREALDIFRQLSGEGKYLRILTIPSAYQATGGGMMNAIVMTTQHHPLAIEDATSGELIWKHPEADAVMAGGRLGGGNGPSVAQPKPAPQAKAQAVAPTVATPQKTAQAPIPLVQVKPAPGPSPAAVPAWFAELKTMAEGMGIPPDLQKNAIVMLREKSLVGTGTAPAQAKAMAIQEVEAALLPAPTSAAIPDWFTNQKALAESMGVPTDMLRGAIITLRTNELTAQGTAPVTAKTTATQEVDAVLRMASAAPVIPDWFINQKALAESMGVPADMLRGAVITLRMNELTAQGTDPAQAKTTATQEVEAILMAESAQPAVARTSGDQAAAGDPPAKRGRSRGPVGPRVALTDIPAFSRLKELRDQEKTTNAQIGLLIGRDASLVSRLFGGQRHQGGLPQDMADQFAAIVHSLETGEPLPAPLSKAERAKAGEGPRRHRATSSQSAVPAGDGAQAVEMQDI